MIYGEPKRRQAMTKGRVNRMQKVLVVCSELQLHNKERAFFMQREILSIVRSGMMMMCEERRS